MLEGSPFSPLELVQRAFAHPVIQAGLLLLNGQRGRLPG
jgi:hypothetical protein